MHRRQGAKPRDGHWVWAVVCGGYLVCMDDLSLFRVEGLITQADILYDPKTGVRVSLDADGWYGMRSAAYDSGDPERILDVIQFEGHVDRIKDATVRAAIILRMHGFSADEISSIIRSHLTGEELLKKGMLTIHGPQSTDH